MPDAELVAAAASATAVVDGPQAAIEELTRAIAARPAGARESGRLHLEARLAVIRSFLPGQRKAASAHLRAHADLPGISPDERTLLGLLAQTGRYEVWPAEEIAATARRALAGGACFEDCAGSIDAMVAWVVALVALISADGFEDARQEVDHAKQRVHRHGSPVEFAMVCSPAIFLNWQLGNVAFVEAEAEGVLAAVAQEDPVPQVIALRATATHFGAYSALERGDVDGAAALLERFDAEHSDVPPVIPTIWLHEPRAGVALARGHPDLARAEAFEQRDQLDAAGVDPPTISWRVPAVRAALLLGDRREAHALADDLVAVARKWNTPTEVGSALRVLAHADPDDRLDLLAESVAVLEPSPARLHLARSLVDLGEALRVAGRRSEAREPLHRGIDLATECGSTALRTRAVAALEALGDRPRRPVFAGVQALTASERRVAALAVTSRANREIAQELFVTPKTVENHLGRIYTKLGINGRRELARALS
ncbi:LuxR C-terminal-related transcriptional regulator [Actinosynnema sp. NPDC023794]